MSEDRPKRKTYSEAMNEWASREGRAAFADRSRVSILVPDPFAHPVVRLLGYLWRLGLVLLLALGGYWFLFRSHLGSRDFAAHFASRVESMLGAENAQISPLSWQGDRVTARQFAATGGPGTFFRTLEAQDVSFRVPFSMLWQREWKLQRLELGSLTVELRSGGLAAAAVPPDAGSDAVPAAFSPPVLSAPGENVKLDATAPDPGLVTPAAGRDKRVLDLKLMKDGFGVAPDLRGLRIGGVEVARFHAGWGISETTRGGLSDGSLAATRGEDGAWLIEMPSATLSQNWLRGLKIANLRARLDDGALTIEETPVQLGAATGLLGGRVRFAEAPIFELTLKGDNFALESFCGEPFDRFFKLQASGTFRIGGSTNLSTGVSVQGDLQATGGFLRGLAIQQALANTTGRVRFREFEITGGTLECATGGGRLGVTSFTLSSRADVTLRGAFTHANGGFSGELQIGVDPALLQKLAPAVQDRFFPKTEDGKRWLTTPLDGTFERLTTALARDLAAAHEAAGKP